MSSRSLALTSSQNWSSGNQHESPHNWIPGNQLGSSYAEYYGPIRPHYIAPALMQYQPEEGGAYAPWRLFEERVRTGPYGLTGFPSQPYSPFGIMVLSPGIEERVNPRLTQFIRDSSPGIRTDWDLRSALQPELPALTDDEFKRAMKQLKKDVYSPTNSPKKKSWPRGLFSNKSSNMDISVTEGKEEAGKAKRQQKNNESKTCAICLEDFVPNGQVVVTPCSHIFHGDCLAPWVKSHGNCPVCRFGFLERIQSNGRALSLNNNNSGRSLNINNNAVASHDNNSDVDLVPLIRAMEEALNWLTVRR